MKKAELTQGSSFGTSTIFLEDPPLSAPFSQKVWSYWENKNQLINSVR